MLKDGNKIDDDLINNLMSWKHSGFSMHNNAKIARDDDKNREAISQYVVRNFFFLEKLTYKQETGSLIYRLKIFHGKKKKKFQVYTAVEFINVITQHISGKSFQMVRSK